MRNQNASGFSNYFSPAEHAFSNYVLQNPRSLLSGAARGSDEPCPDCDDAGHVGETEHSLGSAIAEWLSAARQGQPKSRQAAAKGVLDVVRTNGGAISLAAATTVPGEGAGVEEAIIIRAILKEIGKDLPEGCQEEWEWALEHCRKELAKPFPNRRFTGGHKNIRDCAKGLVSDRCGGNSVRIERR